MRSEQGKMEKSFLNFKVNHPGWQCGAAGDQFIDRLCAFQEDAMASRQEDHARDALLDLAASASLLSASRQQRQHLAASGSGSGARSPRPTGGFGGGASGHFAPIPEKFPVGAAAAGADAAASSGGDGGSEASSSDSGTALHLGAGLLGDLEADLGLSAVLAALHNGTLPAPQGGLASARVYNKYAR